MVGIYCIVYNSFIWVCIYTNVEGKIHIRSTNEEVGKTTVRGKKKKVVPGEIQAGY